MGKFDKPRGIEPFESKWGNFLKWTLIFMGVWQLGELSMLAVRFLANG